MPIKTKNNKASETTTIFLRDAEYGLIRTSYIDFSPLNYRKYFAEEALLEFAEELKQHGVISPITVRLREDGKYELVAGERRLRAARIAGLETIPAAIVELTDEQVIEIQLSENLQRENPHPMHEAQGIGQMQQAGKTIDEISVRLGKSKQFVYSRLKLLSLIESFQEMILTNAITLNEALKIATLSPESQAEFFQDSCSKWKKQKNFTLEDLDWSLNQYRYDLKKAPFNIRDKNLLASAGACTTCPSNSATLKSLFPEIAKQAVCSNKECYNQKCHLHFLAELSNAIDTYQPIALLYRNELTEMAKAILELIPAAKELPRHNSSEICVIQKPETPLEDDYRYGMDDELEEDDFKEAMDSYYSELEKYNLQTKSGHFSIGIFLGNTAFEPVYFNLEKPKPQHKAEQTTTAKEVQAAIKAGTVTPDLLQAEIDHLKLKEKRSEELDAEKVQLAVHNWFTEFVSCPENNTVLSAADKTGLYFLIYMGLDYSTKSKVADVLLKQKGKRLDKTNKDLFERFSKLTDNEIAYLVRMAICSKSDSKFPRQEAGYFLYQMAKEDGVPVVALESSQNDKMKERKEKMQIKLKELKKKMDKLKTK